MRKIILLAVTVSVYMGILLLTFQNVSFRIKVMDSPVIFMPEEMKDFITHGGHQGTALSITVVIIYSLIYAYAAYILALRLVFTKGKHPKNHYKEKPRPNANGFNQKVDDITLMVVFDIPADGIPKEAVDLFPTCEDIYKHAKKVASNNKSLAEGERKSKGSYSFDNLMPASFIRVDRTELDITEKVCDDPYMDSLYKAGVKLLYNHKDWPAAVSEHHGGASLLEHSITTSQNLMDLTNNHRCAAVIGLFHDIGKILAYKNDSKWAPVTPDNVFIKLLEMLHLVSPVMKKVKSFKLITKGHSHLSMLIIKSLPEFNEITKRDQALIEDVMLYGASERTPIRLMKNEEFLMFKRNLSFSDSSALRSEVEKAGKQVADGNRFKDVVALMWKTIETININDYLSKGTNAGFTNQKHDVVMIPLSNILDEMKANASESISEALLLNVDYKDYKSRDMSIIIKALDALEILVYDYHGIYSESAMFKMKSSSIVFEPVVLLKKKEIFEKNPKLEHLWGECKYTLIVNSAFS